MKIRSTFRLVKRLFWVTVLDCPKLALLGHRPNVCSGWKHLPVLTGRKLSRSIQGGAEFGLFIRLITLAQTQLAAR